MKAGGEDDGQPSKKLRGVLHLLTSEEEQEPGAKVEPSEASSPSPVLFPTSFPPLRFLLLPTLLLRLLEMLPPLYDALPHLLTERAPCGQTRLNLGPCPFAEAVERLLTAYKLGLQCKREDADTTCSSSANLAERVACSAAGRASQRSEASDYVHLAIRRSCPTSFSYISNY